MTIKEKYEMMKPENKPKYIAYPDNSAPVEPIIFWSDEELKSANLSDGYKIYQIGNQVTVETKIEIISKPVYRGT